MPDSGQLGDANRALDKPLALRRFGQSHRLHAVYTEPNVCISGQVPLDNGEDMAKKQ